MKTMTYEEAEQYIKDNVEKLNYNRGECFAVRGDNYIPKKKFRKSWNRPDGKKTTRLPGVCACFVAEYDMWGDWRNCYIPATCEYGEYAFLLKGEKTYCELENDEWNKEVILNPHEIIAMLISE